MVATAAVNNNNNKAKTKAKQLESGGGVRKGPWTEQEDVQLVWFVRLLGERRWDFLAKVSGLNRTGKSCRLRWVNYLHPGLKHGRMTPDEERLVLDLHAKWGNRWSRMAKSMPGRTDNEIKNYWRTHMRKQANKARAGSASTTATAPSMPPSQATSSSSSTSTLQVFHQQVASEEEEDAATAPPASQHNLYDTSCMADYPWNDDDFVAAASCGFVVGGWSAAAQLPASPAWDYCSDSLWGMDDDEVLHAS